MRRITAVCLTTLLIPAAALADAQFTADDIIKHFKGAAARSEAAPATANALPAIDDEPIDLPLTGAKRAVTLGGKTATGVKIGNTGGTTVGAPPKTGLNLLVTFESGSDQLTDQAMRNLDTFAEALKSPSLERFAFEVQGHTDAVGAATDNLHLSQRRAESVVAYLVQRGIATNRLQARGYGEARPVMSDPNHPRNRRVETRRIR